MTREQGRFVVWTVAGCIGWFVVCQIALNFFGFAIGLVFCLAPLALFFVWGLLAALGVFDD